MTSFALPPTSAELSPSLITVADTNARELVRVTYELRSMERVKLESSQMVQAVPEVVADADEDFEEQRRLRDTAPAHDDRIGE